MKDDERAEFEGELVDLVRREVDEVANVGVNPTDLSVPHFLIIDVEPLAEDALAFSVHVASDQVLNITAGRQWFDLAARSRNELVEYLQEFLRAAKAGRISETTWEDRKLSVYRSHLRVDFGDRIETFRYFDLREFPLFRRRRREVTYVPY